jgi:cyclohexanone monooxygenase
MTGALLSIDIRGRGGSTLRHKWANGPRTYLGIAIAGFPNLFTITGPGSPSVISNMMVSIEQHVDWIADCLAHLRAEDLETIEATAKAEDAWVAHVNDVNRTGTHPGIGPARTRPLRCRHPRSPCHPATASRPPNAAHRRTPDGA